MSLKLRLYPELDLFRHKYEWKGALQHAKKEVRGSGRFFAAFALTISISLLIYRGLKPLVERYSLAKSAFLVLLPLSGSIIYLFFRNQMRRSLRKQLTNRGIPICIPCGYDLRGQAEPRCPECGTPFDPELLEDQTR